MTSPPTFPVEGYAEPADGGRARRLAQISPHPGLVGTLRF